MPNKHATKIEAWPTAASWSLDRRGERDGPAQSIAPNEIASAKAGPAGGGWLHVGAALLGGGEQQRQGFEALAGWFRGIEAT